MGGQWVCADLRQLHVGFRDARRHLRPQAHHAHRGRGVLRWLRRRGDGEQRRLADRRTRHHGDRCRGQRARHLVHHPARLPRSENTRRRVGHLGRGVGARPGPGPRHRGRPGRLLELACHLLVQPGIRFRRVRPGGRCRPRDVRPSRSPDRRAGVRLRCRVPGLPLLRRDPGGDVGVHRLVDRGAFRRVRCLRRRVHHHGEEGQEPDARPVDVPSSTLCRLQFRRLRRLLRYLLHLLLHGVVPPGRRGRCRRTRRRSISSRWQPG